MKFWGPAAEMEMMETEHEILVRVKGRRRVVDLIPVLLVVIIYGAAVYLNGRSTSPLVIGLVVIVVGLVGWQRLRRKDGELHITEGNFRAVHYAGKPNVNWDKVKKLKYWMGSRNRPKGLYASKNLLISYCLARGWTRSSAER